jgi:sodium/potassium-transporting ATPase subunit alpha
MTEAVIPFNSDIKFNLQIRDLNPGVKNPSKHNDKLVVYMKGAPERILSRCSKILINGKEEDYDEDYKGLVNFANDSFGKMGERVLAFAKIHLDPSVYTKDPKYKFDMKDWKKWFNEKTATP